MPDDGTADKFFAEFFSPKRQGKLDEPDGVPLKAFADGFIFELEHLRPHPGYPLLQALGAAGKTPATMAAWSEKQVYAQGLACAVTWLFANAFRPHFAVVSPSEMGLEQEIPLELTACEKGSPLRVAMAIKTFSFSLRQHLNDLEQETFRDATQVRAEHPNVVLASVVHLPFEAGRGKRKSPFTQVVETFKGSVTKNIFDLFYIGLYVPDGKERGRVIYHKVTNTEPTSTSFPPTESLVSFEEVISEVVSLCEQRNLTQNLRGPA